MFQTSCGLFSGLQELCLDEGGGATGLPNPVSSTAVQGGRIIFFRPSDVCDLGSGHRMGGSDSSFPLHAVACVVVGGCHSALIPRACFPSLREGRGLGAGGFGGNLCLSGSLAKSFHEHAPHPPGCGSPDYGVTVQASLDPAHSTGRISGPFWSRFRPVNDAVVAEGPGGPCGRRTTPYSCPSAPPCGEPFI